ncbi:G/T mismatches repair enzyme [Nanobdella aerobiophila]|uniref:G/T mismatches repair enzyme n=1 Tax=Nanobdella aerobiophila TaxID=2586965 RepID=A0A915WS26_9ARCH|nr:endonuclease III [Nanobdella aerobiophila]BBL45461.1 G/T mismatches repair enzyme [Nanobdella aerobiophila]
MIEEIIYNIDKTLKDNKINEILASPYIWEKYKDSFKVLITILLSIRLREEKTLEVSKRLFNIYKDIESIKKASLEDIKNTIKDIGLYNNKAKWIKEIAELWDYNKQCDEDFIRSLPGIGRKIANVYFIIVCNKNYIAVDTHVHRIFNRIGIVNTKNPEKTEEELYKIIPEKYWKDINFKFVLFGRNICKPVNPRCIICNVRIYCNYGRKRIIDY